MTRDRTAEADAGLRYADDTTNHELTILHDEGLYRHLRVKKSGSSSYWFDVITWPGNLTITGDMGTYSFAREQDMFPWFGYDRAAINPQYWSQKLQAADKNTGVREYSREVLIEAIREHLTGGWTVLDEDALAEVRRDVDEKLLDEDGYHGYDTSTEQGAHDALNRYAGPNGFEFVDAWEWDLTEYSYQYLWCCHAILDAIRRYRAVKTPALVEGATA